MSTEKINVKEALKNGRVEFPRTKEGVVDFTKPQEPRVLFAFQVEKSGPIDISELAILKIPYTEKVRVDGRDYFQGVRNFYGGGHRRFPHYGVQRRFHCDETKYRYFDTWDDAWAYLCCRAKTEVASAESRLQRARDVLAAVAAMRCDWYTKIGAEPPEPKEPRDGETPDIPH
jgi:hypothetical protein